MELEQYRILSLEACDICRGMDSDSKKGYKLPKKGSRAYYKKFRNTLDWSLDTIQLHKIYNPENAKKDNFYQVDKYGFKYTLAVVSVSFKYTYKEILSKEKTDDGKTNITYGDVILDTAKLRTRLYEDGFKINGKEYVRYKRSASNSRDGRCLFILKKLYAKMNKWSRCGLSPKKLDIVSFEAYQSLSLSSINGLIKIPISSILFINDQVIEFTDNVVSIEKKDNTLVATEKQEEIRNDIWDGEALLDESLFTKNLVNKHMLLLRNKFFKSCGFRTKLQKWFKDNNITKVEQLKEFGGVTLASKVEDIVMVTTPNSLKYLKFLKGGLTEDNIRKWAKYVDNTFGIVKCDKRTRFFDGRMVQTSYQFLNTLHFTKEEAETLVKKHAAFISWIRSEPAIMNYYFEHLTNREKDNFSFDEDDSKEESLAFRAGSILSLLKVNSDFANTQLFSDLMYDLVDAMKDRLYEGHFLINGTNATLFGNGPEMLRQTVGKFDGKSELKPGEVRIEKFKDGEELVCARSPHITMGNLYSVTNNYKTDGIWEYFTLGDNVVCVNAIGDNIQQRLNGCDYDSDAMLITNDPVIVKTTKEQYKFFKVPYCHIKPVSVKGESLDVIDTKLSNDNTGIIVNLSQRLNSKLWDMVNSGQALDSDDVKKLYNDICILAVLSGMEIDKAKRSYGIDSSSIITKLLIDHEEILQTEPQFFKYIKGKGDSKKPYVEHKTTMDYINKAIHEFVNYNSERIMTTKIQLEDLFVWTDEVLTRNDYNKINDIVEICNTFKATNSSLQHELSNSKDEYSKEVIQKDIVSIRNDYSEQINKILKRESVLKKVLEKVSQGKITDKKGNKDNGIWLVVSILFQPNNAVFAALLKRSKDKNKKLPTFTEELDGQIQIFDYFFDLRS